MRHRNRLATRRWQPTAAADLARIERNVDSVVADQLGTIEGYLRLVCQLADNLMEAVERMELDERIPADLWPVWISALHLTQGDMTTPEERIGYFLALTVLAATPEAGCQGLAAELLSELRKHDSALRFLR